jgi:predicted nuclease with RNAse H fold
MYFPKYALMDKNRCNLIGIDYGAKLAGTTAVAIFIQETNKVDLYCSVKKQDSDAFILDLLHSLSAAYIGIDAPLSLPGKYIGLPDCTDYFYRSCDKELQAMSPMFLGGLTARAMALKEKLSLEGHRCFEVYPSALAKTNNEWSKLRSINEANELAEVFHGLSGLDLKNHQNNINKHMIDALLALQSVRRYINGSYMLYGFEEEGQIVV